MSVVGSLAVSHIPKILVGTPLYESVRVLVRKRFLPVPALVVPAPLPVSIHAGSHDVPGIPDQKDHAALRQRLHEQGSAYRAVGFLDNQVLILVQVREPRLDLVEDKVPYGLEPALPVTSKDEVFCFVALLVGPEVVEVTEEQPHHRLSPQGLPPQLVHHPHQPGAAGPPVTEDPDYIFGLDAFAVSSPSRQLPTSLFETPVAAGRTLPFSVGWTRIE